MITEDDLRTLLADREVPSGLSPSVARRRAAMLRRRRQARVACAIGVVVPMLVAGAMTVRLPSRDGGQAPGPQAFGGDGEALPVRADGAVPLQVAGLYAYDDAGALCFGPDPAHVASPGTRAYQLPGECLVHGSDGDGTSVGGGVVGTVVSQPVVRADFVSGSTVVHAQVVGLRVLPRWRTLTAAWPAATTNVEVRGWDAAGNLVLAFGCDGTCPRVAQVSQPAVAPEPQPHAPAVPAATSSPAGP